MKSQIASGNFLGKLLFIEQLCGKINDWKTQKIICAKESVENNFCGNGPEKNIWGERSSNVKSVNKHFCGKNQKKNFWKFVFAEKSDNHFCGENLNFLW